jgi:hypothetical protein
MSSYTQLDKLAVARGKPTDRKRIGNNTYVVRLAGGALGVKLHDTVVARYTREDVTLNTGGWHTSTTKARINDHLPPGVRLFSNKGDWFVSGYAIDVPGHFNVPFADGICLRVTSDYLWAPVEGTYPDPTQEQAAREAKKKVTADVKAYLTKAAESFPRWVVTLREQGYLNTAGDCFYCQGIVTTTDGRVAEDNNHLWAHLRDGYVFPSLFIVALRDKGFREPQKTFASNLLYGQDRLLDILKVYLIKRLSRSSEPTTNTYLLEHALEQAKDVLTKPDDFGYFGSDEHLWVASAPTWTKHRGSGNEEVANFEVVWTTLKAEFTSLFDADLDDEGYPSRDFNSWPAIYVFGAGHWAVGHIDQIVVPVLLDKTKPLSIDNLHPAYLRVVEFGISVGTYPLLDGGEEIVARLDLEDAKRDIRQYLQDPTDEQVGIVYREMVLQYDGYPEYLENDAWVALIEGIDPAIGLVLQEWVVRV